MRAHFHDDRVRIKVTAVRAFGETHVRLSALERTLRPMAPLEDTRRRHGIEVLTVKCGGGRYGLVTRLEARLLVQAHRMQRPSPGHRSSASCSR